MTIGTTGKRKTLTKNFTKKRSMPAGRLTEDQDFPAAILLDSNALYVRTVYYVRNPVMISREITGEK
jgi:hypothetical protein